HGSSGHELHKVRLSQTRWVDLAAEPKKPAEVHNQRTPAYWVDVGARTLAQQKIFVDVQLHNVHFKHVGVHVLSERPVVMHDALHLYWAFEHTGRSHRLRLDGSEPSHTELIPFVAITPLLFLFRYGILTGCKGQAVYVRDQIFGGQIDHAVARAN